jgi:hypothetical protein
VDVSDRSSNKYLSFFIAAYFVNGKCPRPAAVGVNNLVDLFHKADGLGEGDDDLLIVRDVALGERATLAVLEPLFADLALQARV